MPRVSLATDYLLHSPCCASDHDSTRYYRTTSSNERRSVLSPDEIDEILSRKLYSQLKATTESVSSAQEHNSTDPELILLIDRFFSVTYLNTVPMVNLLATAVATNFLKENIRELDKSLQEEQASYDIKRGTSLLYKVDNETDDDDNLSWASAPT